MPAARTLEEEAEAIRTEAMRELSTPESLQIAARRGPNAPHLLDILEDPVGAPADATLH